MSEKPRCPFEKLADQKIPDGLKDSLSEVKRGITEVGDWAVKSLRTVLDFRETDTSEVSSADMQASEQKSKVPIVELSNRDFFKFMPFILPDGEFFQFAKRFMPGNTPQGERKYDILKFLTGLYECLPKTEGQPRSGVVRLPSPPIKQVYDPSIVHEILFRTDSFSQMTTEMKKLKKLFGEAFIFVDVKDKKWQKGRAALKSKFTPDAIQKSFDVLQETCAEEIEGWENGASLEITEACGSIAFKSIARLTLGENHEDIAEDIQSVWDGFQEEALKAALNPFMPPNEDIWIHFVPQELRQRKEQVDDRLIEAIQRDKDVKNMGFERPSSFLKALNDYRDDQGQALTSNEVLDHLKILLFGGHDTTKVTLSWMLYLLAKHPDIREKMYAELSQLENSDIMKLSAINFEQLCPTAHGVIKEVNRLYPPPVLARLCVKDTEINGVTFKAGENVQTVSLFYLRDERWSHTRDGSSRDPEAFDPTRWTEGGGPTDEQKMLSDMIFGVAPRFCLGKALAYAELRAFMCQLVRQGVQLNIPSGMPEPTPNLGVNFAMKSYTMEVAKWEPVNF